MNSSKAWRLAFVVSLLASVAPAASLRVAVYGGSATAFLQEQAPEYGLEVLEVSDRQVIAGQVDTQAFDLLLLLGGGGRSDGQLLQGEVRDPSLAGEPIEAPTPQRGRRGGGSRGGADARRSVTPEEAAAAERMLRDALGSDSSVRVVAVSEVYSSIRSRHPDLVSERLIEDQRLGDYLGRGHVSRENLRRLLEYLAITYAGAAGEPPAPAPVTTVGFYTPEHGDFFPTVEALIRHAEGGGLDAKTAPRVLVLANYTHFVSRNREGIDAMLRALSERDALAACVIVEEPENRLAMLEFEPDATIDAFHRGDDLGFREQLGAPHLQALWLSARQTIEQWRDGATSVRSMLGVETGESLGSIEPHIVAGRSEGSAGYRPIPDRVDRLAGRAVAWARLHRKPNADKRVVMLMSGGPGGDLDNPASLLKVLQAMERVGYQIEDPPRSVEELLERVEDHGEQINPPEHERLDRLARSGKAALIPVEQYRQWFEARVPEQQRRQAIERWGELPGEVMVWRNDADERFLVVPLIDLGGVALVPKPAPWSDGERLEQADSHKRERGSPPSHNILATHFWLEESRKADAVVVWGNLGFDILSAGKAIGLRSSDWPDILMGDLPNLRPYSLGAITFALPAKRRAKAVLVDYLPAPRLAVGLDDELFGLRSELLKWDRLREGPLKERFRKSITARVRELRLDEDLLLSAEDSLTDEGFDALSTLLAEYESERVAPVKHVLGEPPATEVEVPYLVRILGERLLDALEASQPASVPEELLPGERRNRLRGAATDAVSLIVRHGAGPAEAAESIGVAPERVSVELIEQFELAAHLHQAIDRSSDEVENLLRGMEGRFVPPGPSAPPERNTASVPTGRNMYVMNPEEIPSRQSWEVACRLVDELLERSLREKGELPDRIAYTIRTRSTMSDFGVTEAQILYTLGVRPIWGRSGRVSDIEPIPRDELGRPRIDVFIEPKHYYAEYLESRMRLIDRAVRMAAELDEEGNAVRRHCREVEEALVASGVDRSKASAVAFARMFSVAPERFGSGLHDKLFGATGVWDSEDSLVDIYAHQHAFAYTDGLWGIETVEGFREQLRGTDAVVRSMNRGSALSGRAAYSGGMLAMAAEKITGEKPDYFLTDLRNPGAERLYDARQAVRRALRTELLNSKWIQDKMAKPRGGAIGVRMMVEKVLDWSVTTPGVIDQSDWREIAEVYLHDKKGVGVAEWLAAGHPEAYSGVLETLLEAVRKGYWQADPELVAELAQRRASLLADEPLENEALASFLAERLGESAEGQVAAAVASPQPKSNSPAPDAAPGAAEPMLAAEAPQPATKATPETVSGQRLAPTNGRSNPSPGRFLYLLAVVALLALGAWRRVGSPT